MYSDWYAKISAPFRSRPRLAKALNLLDKGLVYLIAAVYIAMLIWLFVCAIAQEPATSALGNAVWSQFWNVLLVPAVGFAICTIVRKLVNAPRPYEKFQIDPVIHKDTSGKSFPSRHIFSACVISCALLYINAWMGIAAFAATAVVCYCRIVGGVHFPRDVVGALALALACGAIGFLLL